MRNPGYVGRFAPSPTGPLHRGSLVAAMASFLDARAHGGKWLVRIEDVDAARTALGASELIVRTLAQFGMVSDGPVLIQSDRLQLYQRAFTSLHDWVFACACTRKEIADSQIVLHGADGAAVYPGTCRAGIPEGRRARAYRLRVPAAGDRAGEISFYDRWQGPQSENLATCTGDFVLKRADGFWAYQLAVVVDDAEQGVTDVVRGADLLASTGRQIYLQRLLGLTASRYLHVPAVLNAAGEKLSKQTGAEALDSSRALIALTDAAHFLTLPLDSTATLSEFWESAIAAWSDRFLAPRFA